MTEMGTQKHIFRKHIRFFSQKRLDTVRAIAFHLNICLASHFLGPDSADFWNKDSLQGV